MWALSRVLKAAKGHCAVIVSSNWACSSVSTCWPSPVTWPVPILVPLVILCCSKIPGFSTILRFPFFDLTALWHSSSPLSTWRKLLYLSSLFSSLMFSKFVCLTLCFSSCTVSSVTFSEGERNGLPFPVLPCFDSQASPFPCFSLVVQPVFQRVL